MQIAQGTTIWVVTFDTNRINDHDYPGAVAVVRRSTTFPHFKKLVASLTHDEWIRTQAIAETGSYDPAPKGWCDTWLVKRPVEFRRFVAALGEILSSATELQIRDMKPRLSDALRQELVESLHNRNGSIASWIRNNPWWMDRVSTSTVYRLARTLPNELDEKNSNDTYENHDTHDARSNPHSHPNPSSHHMSYSLH